MYQKYKDKGFVVIGVCTELESNRAKVEKILADKKVAWPTLFTGDESYEAQAKNPYVTQYGFGPWVKLLFDKQGRLRQLQVEPHDLEEAVQKLLEE